MVLVCFLKYPGHLRNVLYSPMMMKMPREEIHGPVTAKATTKGHSSPRKEVQDSPWTLASGFEEKLCSANLEHVTWLWNRITSGSVCMYSLIFTPLSICSLILLRHGSETVPRTLEFLAKRKGHIDSCWRQSKHTTVYTKEINFTLNLKT